MRTCKDRGSRALLLGLGLSAGVSPALAENVSGRGPSSNPISLRPPVVSAGPDGFAIGSADRDYALRIRGNLHADARFHLGEGREDTFLLRRVRPSFEGTIARDFRFRVTPEFAGSSSSLIDASIEYTINPALNFQVGKFKVPFDLERLVSQTNLLFVERSYTSSLGPNRDNGIHVFGELFGGRLSYNLALINGTADGGSSITDEDSDKEMVGRVFTRPFQSADSPWRGLGVGLAITHGDRFGAVPAGYRTHAQQRFFAWNADVVSLGSQTRFEPQAHFYHGPFGLIGAWAASRQGVTNGINTAKIQNTAWFIAASFVLTGEAASFQAVTPHKEFDPAHGHWGALEIALRYAELDIDDDAFPTFADSATSATRVASTTAGVNWYLNRNLKLVLNWEHSDFDGGGTKSATAESENAILTRVQLRF